VLLVGDSLTRQAQAVFTGTIVASGRAVVDGTLVFSGTALCTWFPALEPKLNAFRPQVAVVEFLGNNFGACMQDPATGAQVTGVNPASGRPASQVRSPDGVHLCPVGNVFDCPVWSSGAWRFGRAMAAPVVRDYKL